MQLAVLASVDHQHVAAVLSLLYISGGLGGAIGNTISGTIWTDNFEKGLVRHLPKSAQANLTTINASLPAQLAYPVNSPERVGIQMAYGYAQTRMLAAGVGLMGLSLVWICFIKNLNLSKMKQTKGVVFRGNHWLVRDMFGTVVCYCKSLSYGTSLSVVVIMDAV